MILSRRRGVGEGGMINDPLLLLLLLLGSLEDKR